MALSTLLGYPRIGQKRELKSALETYWKGETDEAALRRTAAALREAHWSVQKTAGIDCSPTNDFSLYDQMLDMSAHLGVVPPRYRWKGGDVDLVTYFAMARGRQQGDIDVAAAEMSKWFDTNYHYIVPEFSPTQKFTLSTTKPESEFLEAKKAGFNARPMLIGPLTYLLLGKQPGGKNIDLLDRLLPIYVESLKRLEKAGAEWIQLDEPALVLDLDRDLQSAYEKAYRMLGASTSCRLFVTTYFDSLGDNLTTALKLPVDAIHIDLVRGAEQLDAVLEKAPQHLILSLGVVDGRNIWRNDLSRSLGLLERAAELRGVERIWVSPSCSLLHTPYDLDLETQLDPELKSWMAFSKQKLHEVAALTTGLNHGRGAITAALEESREALAAHAASPRIHNPAVADRLVKQPLSSAGRATAFEGRRRVQQAQLHLPLFPTTTIGSFPQTSEVRARRADVRNKRMTASEYDAFLKAQVKSAIEIQEAVGLDVLVHGEFERNDMVEYFGEQLAGFAFTRHGWVQSYGSRCVKPPIIFGDVTRRQPMTVAWSQYAQGLTKKPVKGMLTGPVTILQWSFVRVDQPRSVTTHQLALALQDEVKDLERAGIQIIQIDEPAFREGLPLRRADWDAYLLWASRAFRLSSTGVKDQTQIHTHMCYCEFNDIFDAIKGLDADVISIETSRSQMELLDAFRAAGYPNEIGPGVYDIHSPRVPDISEMTALLDKASKQLEPWQIWVNPDCGLKTRNWPETRAALEKMVAAAEAMRAKYAPSTAA